VIGAKFLHPGIESKPAALCLEEQVHCFVSLTVVQEDITGARAFLATPTIHYVQSTATPYRPLLISYGLPAAVQLLKQMNFMYNYVNF
jgi:hypothetical protein